MCSGSRHLFKFWEISGDLGNSAWWTQQTFRPSNPGGSQEHISLITNSFFNDFSFIIQFQHKGYLHSLLYLISFSFTTGHFCMCVILKKIYYFAL